MRVASFVDGFNLYHAIDDLGKHHLKWLNIRKLCQHFAPFPEFDLTAVYYFSAYATWRTEALMRHRKYVKALGATGVIPILGKFKAKSRSCRSCGHTWEDHEEKETDVNIALNMLRESYRNSYDQMMLISADSDLAPAVRIIREEFPEKQIKIIIPVNRGYSWDLVNAAGGKKFVRRMKPIHLERSLFDKEVIDDTGRLVVVRPEKYDPPAR